MNAMSNIARVTAILSASFLLALPAVARSDPDQGPSFGEIVDVRVINLEVVVTDDGDRVSGLGAQDFELLVDGEPVPIGYFTEVRNGYAVQGTGATQTPDAFAVPALEPGQSVGTRYLVFIDDFFAIATYRDRILGEIAEQLPLMSADDRMAIVAFDGDQVEMLSSWTRSLAELGAALDQATRRRAYGLQRLSEQRQFDTTARFTGRSYRGSRFASTAYAGTRRGFVTLDGVERQRAWELASQVKRVADGATSALQAFARPPGRKVMLLLSGGWPARPASWVAGRFDAVFDDAGLDGWQAFENLTETANRLGYTLYPVDVNGVGGNAIGSAEYGNVLEAELASDQSRHREWLDEDTLFRLAAATGGRAFVDGAGYTALERAVEDTRSYYWLGFSPAWQEDDELHRVKIEVKGKGLKVRSRGSYSDLSMDSELTMLVDSAQLFDLPLLGDETLGVTFGEPTSSGFKKALLPMRIEIPLDSVTLLTEGGKTTAEIELRVAATDDHGDRADTPVVPLVLTGTVPSSAGQMAVFETQLKLRRQDHRLLISVYDPASGRMLSKRVAVSL